MSKYKNNINGHQERGRYHPSRCPGPQLEASSSLAFSSLKPRETSILWQGDSTSDQMPRSRSFVVTSPLSPVNSKRQIDENNFKKLSQWCTVIFLPVLDSSSQRSLIQAKSGKYTRQEHALLQQPRTKSGQAKRQYELCIMELKQELGECEY